MFLGKGWNSSIDPMEKYGENSKPFADGNQLEEADMRLEVESIDIRDIRMGPKTYAEDRGLHINPKELEELLLKDGRIKSVDIDVVCPGDQVRIVNLLDVVQPRCKIDQFEADFPGFVGRLRIAGSGRTRSLRGVAVLVSNPCTKRKYSALLDMCGLGAELSKYGKMRNVSIAPYIADGTEERDFEDAVKIAGLKTAVYLALAAEGLSPDEVEAFKSSPNSLLLSDVQSSTRPSWDTRSMFLRNARSGPHAHRYSSQRGLGWWSRWPPYD
jgi:hypothetical protein